MHFRRPAGLSRRAQDSEADHGGPDVAGPQGDAAAETAPKRPFVERRRSRRVEQSWPEALDALRRILLGFENGNKQQSDRESRFRAIFEDAPVGIFELSPDGALVNLNAAMARIFGYESTEQVLTDSADGIISLFDPALWNSYEASGGNRDVRGFDLQMKGRDGRSKWVRCHVRAIKQDDRVQRYEGTAEDITERKLVEVHTERLAYYDALTGLPNRTLFLGRLESVLQKALSNKTRAALLLLQVDRFKIINDSLGQRFGDRLLQEIARRVTLATGRNSIVSRVGGAEFAIVIENIDLDDLQGIAARVMAKLAGQYSFFGHSLNVSCNLGISSFPKDCTDSETLISAAETAMCFAREEGLNTFRLFTDEMSALVQENLRMERGLRDALSKNELFLVYQPQVDMRSGRVTGLEALLRWEHPNEGLILPGKFIGVAESSGLIVPIGEWVLRTACAQARKWQEQGLPPVPIAVNVSAIQFRQQGFSDLIREVLHETGLRPEYLELELTESLLLSNADVMFSTIQELKQMGVMLAIDDFGTGYSSLGYLRQFKVNRLKIARAFIQDVSIDADDAAITTAIINMAKALNLAVLAEGVENADQLSFLQSQQCFTIQGFYFSKPVAVDQIDQHLRSGFSQFSSAALQ
jgi:diguanylate cyclase (GGDEF)-like protein/PAS domain S-box-containing protein